jgi:hypothetical protein
MSRENLDLKFWALLDAEREVYPSAKHQHIGICGQCSAYSLSQLGCPHILHEVEFVLECQKEQSVAF